MDRLAQTSLLLSGATAMAALIVVGTAPNDFPTLTAPILGRQIPSPQSDIRFCLDLAAAACAGVFGARVARHRLAGTLVAALVVARRRLPSDRTCLANPRPRQRRKRRLTRTASP